MAKKAQEMLDIGAIEIAAAAAQTAQHALVAIDQHQKDCANTRREMCQALVEAAKESREGKPRSACGAHRKARYRR